MALAHPIYGSLADPTYVTLIALTLVAAILFAVQAALPWTKDARIGWATLIVSPRGGRALATELSERAGDTVQVRASDGTMGALGKLRREGRVGRDHHPHGSALSDCSGILALRSGIAIGGDGSCDRTVLSKGLSTKTSPQS
jgi:hypothetical protein